MKIFTLPFFACTLFCLCSFQFSFANGPNGPNGPNFLKAESRTSLNEVKLLFDPLGEEQGDRLFDNLLVIAGNNPSRPIAIDPNFEVPVEGLQNLDYDRLRRINEIGERQIQIHRRCDCGCGCEEELNFWVFFRELILRGIKIKEIEEERRREEQRRREEEARRRRRVRTGRTTGDPHITTFDGQKLFLSNHWGIRIDPFFHP